MKNFGVFLLLFSFCFAKAQTLEVLNKNGDIIDRVITGKILYRIKDDRKIYKGNITRFTKDTIYLSDGFIKLDEISFIDQLTDYKAIVYTSCNSLNYALIPIQYGVPSLLLSSTDESVSNNDIVVLSISSFIITQLMRGCLLLFRNSTLLDGRLEQRNCTYKYVA